MIEIKGMIDPDDLGLEAIENEIEETYRAIRDLAEYQDILMEARDYLREHPEEDDSVRQDDEGVKRSSR